MHQLAFKAYGEVTNRTASDQQIDYALFREITQALNEIAQQDDPLPSVWADAIDRNLQLWTLLSTDLMNSDNQLPAEIRKSLLSIAESVRRISYDVLSGGGEMADLIEINETIMQGLSGAPAQSDNAVSA